jgi:phosphoserine phosphatase RsbU/P
VNGDAAAQALFEEAPCGYVICAPDGAIRRANRTLEAWLGIERAQLLGRRLQDLLGQGGRIYYETHIGPLLLMQGAVREIAVELSHADGSSRAALLNAVVERGPDGEPASLRVMLFDATERRRYERELLAARAREQAVADELQRSLLAGAPPHAPGLTIDVAYRTAVRGQAAGGDWHDAFWLQDGATVAVVAGDVVGRGISAAATMGQLRSATRALAGTGLGPAETLEALDRFARRHEVGRMATVVMAEVGLAGGAVRYACAGHPPPIVVGPSCPAEPQWAGRSVPLDAHLSDGQPRAEGELTLADGATLVLYTDGLIERRGRLIDDGIDVLCSTLDRLVAAGEPQLATAATRAVHDPGHIDDMCAVAITRG